MKPGVLPPDSVEALLAQHKMALQEQCHVDRHLIELLQADQHFELQQMQLQVLQAEIAESTVKLQLELERVCTATVSAPAEQHWAWGGQGM